MRALRVVHLSLGIAFVPRLGFLVRTLLIMTKRAATPASVLLAWALFMAVVGSQVTPSIVFFFFVGGLMLQERGEFWRLS